VDGFNLYYRAVKRTPYKWLDVDALSRYLLPKASIERINYYTARVTGRTIPTSQRDKTFTCGR
jgi:hypothetical protein